MTQHASEKRTRPVKVLLTEPEYAKLMERARASGRQTISEEVRAALFEPASEPMNECGTAQDETCSGGYGHGS